MQATQKKMRDAAAALFTGNKVDVIIGFRDGSLVRTARPYFARNAKDVEKLVWNQYCVSNLATFLPRLFEKPARPPKDYKPPRVGIIAKGCDARSVAGLLKEKQVPKEN